MPHTIASRDEEISDFGGHTETMFCEQCQKRFDISPESAEDIWQTQEQTGDLVCSEDCRSQETHKIEAETDTKLIIAENDIPPLGIRKGDHLRVADDKIVAINRKFS